MKTKLGGVVFLAFLLVASAASAIDIAEFAMKSSREQARYTVVLIEKEINAVKKKNLAQGICLEMQLFKIDENSDGIPDGQTLIAQLITLAYEKGQYRKSVESIINVGTDYIAKKHCSGAE